MAKKGKERFEASSLAALKARAVELRATIYHKNVNVYMEPVPTFDATPTVQPAIMAKPTAAAEIEKMLRGEGAHPVTGRPFAAESVDGGEEEAAKGEGASGAISGIGAESSSGRIRDIFGSLVPQLVAAAVDEHEEATKTEIGRLKEEASTELQRARDRLQALGLPGSIDAAEQTDGVPDDLWRRVEGVRI